MMFELLTISTTLLLLVLVLLLFAFSSTKRSDSIRKGYQSRRDVRKIKQQIEEEE